MKMTDKRHERDGYCWELRRDMKQNLDIDCETCKHKETDQCDKCCLDCLSMWEEQCKKAN